MIVAILNRQAKVGRVGMLSEKEIREQINRTLTERENVRQALGALEPEDMGTRIALCMTQSGVMGKLVGLQLSLGASPEYLSHELTDSYWFGGCATAPKHFDLEQSGKKLSGS